MRWRGAVSYTHLDVYKRQVFKHSKELGDCPAYKLFDAVEVKKNEDVEYPRRYQDYTVEIHEDRIPEMVEVKRMI